MFRIMTGLAMLLVLVAMSAMAAPGYGYYGSVPVAFAAPASVVAKPVGYGHHGYSHYGYGQQAYGHAAPAPLAPVAFAAPLSPVAAHVAYNPYSHY